jgi:hypothetical protein
MPEYEYTGPGPHDDGDGGTVRPGDVREFDTEPDWGPWRLIEPDEPRLVTPPDEKSPPPPATPVVITPDGPKPPPPAAAAPAPKQGE